MPNISWMIPGIVMADLYPVKERRFDQIQGMTGVGNTVPYYQTGETVSSVTTWSTYYGDGPTGSSGLMGISGKPAPWSREYKKQNQHLFRRGR